MKRMRRLGMTNTGQTYTRNRINIDTAERGRGEETAAVPLPWFSRV